MSMAQIQLLGNLGRDPEMNYMPDGTAVCRFSIAVSRKVKGNEETTWYNCVAWRNLAEMLSTHLKKGQMVFVQGDLNVRQYTTRDGRNGFSLDVTIDKFQFAGGKKEESPTPIDTSNDDPLKGGNATLAVTSRKVAVARCFFNLECIIPAIFTMM